MWGQEWVGQGPDKTKKQPPRDCPSSPGKPPGPAETVGPAAICGVGPTREAPGTKAKTMKDQGQGNRGSQNAAVGQAMDLLWVPHDISGQGPIPRKFCAILWFIKTLPDRGHISRHAAMNKAKHTTASF